MRRDAVKAIERLGRRDAPDVDLAGERRGVDVGVGFDGRAGVAEVELGVDGIINQLVEFGQPDILYKLLGEDRNRRGGVGEAGFSRLPESVFS